MIEYVQNGDLFASGCEAFVCPCNCVGVMGAGLALDFKCRYPGMFIDYQRACRRGLVRPGTVYPVKVPGNSVGVDGFGHELYEGSVWIVNFATKDHWKDPSKLEWIEQGLGDLRRWIKSVKPDSIAIPALGSGLGGLEYSQVKPLIAQRLQDLDLRIVVFEPRTKR